MLHARAMVDFELAASGRVDASPDLVWSNLMDPEVAPSWLEGVSAVVGKGPDFRVRLGETPEPDWLQGEVLEADPKNRLSFILVEPSLLVRSATVRLTLEPSEPGERGTKFLVEIVGTFRALGALLSPLLRLRAEVTLRRAIRGFRSMIENAQRKAGIT